MGSTNVVSQIKDVSKDIVNHGKEMLGLNNENTYIYFVLALVIVAFIIFLVISWVVYTLNKKDAACKKLNSIYLADSKHKTNSFFTREGNTHAKQSTSPENYFDNEYKNLIKNYYIKTAYNACCGDGYKNNFVNICALEKCIDLGARCLDFEIYSYNGEPIVAASTANNNSIKETYNYISFPQLLTVLDNRSFDSNTSCGNDPMFLHFRIMSENKVIYDKMGEYIEKYLNHGLLDIKTHNYKNTDQDPFLLSHIADKKFHKKFIIMVNTLHVPILDSSKLAKYVHIRSGSNALKCIRYEQVVAAGINNPMMIDDSHRNLTIVLPNIDNTLENHDPLLPLNNGCQFVAMKFQNIDNNLLGYYKMFNVKGGYSFVLKPNDLRKDIIPPEPIADDIPLNEQQIYSMQTQLVESSDFEQPPQESGEQAWNSRGVPEV